MFKRIALLVLIFQFQGTIRAAQQQASDDLNTRLSTRVNIYNLTAGSFVEALSQAAGEFRIPMGIMWVNKPVAKGRLSLSWSGATVQEIIEEIVATQAGYQVQVSNGIVHVSPTEITPKQNFLLINIDAFAVPHQVLPLAMRNLHDRVTKIVSPPKPQTYGGSGGSLASNPDEPQIDLHFDHASVEEILDSLAKISLRKIWIVTFDDSFILTAGGFRRTMSLWSDSPAPESEQPVWDMFSWEKPIPTRALRDK
jgi:hypothetical protein